MLRVSTVVRLIPFREPRVVSETTSDSALVIPASKLRELRALSVTREMSPTSFNWGKDTELRDWRMFKVKDDEMLTRLGALMLERVVMLVATRLPSIEVTPLMAALVMGEARIMSPSNLEHEAMRSKSACEEAVRVLEHTCGMLVIRVSLIHAWGETYHQKKTTTTMKIEQKQRRPKPQKKTCTT